MKKRVYYKTDGTVMVMHQNPNFQETGESDEDYINRIASLSGQIYQELDYDDIEETALPDALRYRISQYRRDRDKWRGNKQQGLYVDNTIITERERREGLQAQIDEELDKAVPNAGKVLKLQRDLKG